MSNEKKELSFEENLEKLEEIVKKLENGDVPLDDAIKEFNEAMVLAKKCDEKLKSAEEAITKIVNNDDSVDDFEVKRIKWPFVEPLFCSESNPREILSF